MAKIQLLAVISIDGCPMKLHPRKRLLQTEDYGMDEIRANALYKLTSDYSVSVLQEWREEGGSICHLLEVTAGNTEYANGLLRMNVIDEIYRSGSERQDEARYCGNHQTNRAVCDH